MKNVWVILVFQKKWTKCNLKRKLLCHLPKVQAQSDGKNVLLIFDIKMKQAVNYEDDRIILSKTAKFILWWYKFRCFTVYWFIWCRLSAEISSNKIFSVHAFKWMHSQRLRLTKLSIHLSESIVLTAKEKSTVSQYHSKKK